MYQNLEYISLSLGCTLEGLGYKYQALGHKLSAYVNGFGSLKNNF